ncbi:MAG TPA: hypothetical protein DEH27_08780 [Deltaproteobacteria bacterium]|nr:hypothetical protein [Deltaproteobacteria bacterium]
MRRYEGGESAVRGTYWNLRYGGLVEMKQEGILPGGPHARYYRIPFVFIPFLALVLGGVYVIFLPVIMITMATYLLGKRMFGGILSQTRRSVSFGWRPTEAYLSGKNKKKETGDQTTE